MNKRQYKKNAIKKLEQIESLMSKPLKGNMCFYPSILKQKIKEIIE